MAERHEEYRVIRQGVAGEVPTRVKFTSEGPDGFNNPKQAATDYAQKVFKSYNGKYRVFVRRVETEIVYDTGKPA